MEEFMIEHDLYSPSKLIDVLNILDLKGICRQHKWKNSTWDLVEDPHLVRIVRGLHMWLYRQFFDRHKYKDVFAWTWEDMHVLDPHF